ncbi:hypothetical protein HPB50_024585 [Hyalomma asiaticum]|uniref:Uncharacterized protein n=1 Tax=Hyalomma asiaticum TaxID=266040 RepID=A0ACB7T173_HYAAI|nr:hypothetical protein HPB50_024585 [Hyalomma asiaticum]
MRHCGADKDMGGKGDDLVLVLAPCTSQRRGSHHASTLRGQQCRESVQANKRTAVQKWHLSSSNATAFHNRERTNTSPGDRYVVLFAYAS